MEKLERLSADATLCRSYIEIYWEGYGITVIKIRKYYFSGKYFSVLVADTLITIWWDPKQRTQIVCA